MIVHSEIELLVPAHLNFGRFMLDRLRQANPDHTCLRNCTTGDGLTYRQYAQHAVRLAAALAQRGVGRGDTVAVAGEPRVTFLPTKLAVILTGAAYTHLELEFCGKRQFVNAMLTYPEALERLVDAEQDHDLSSLKIIYSTGEPVAPQIVKAFRNRYPETKLVLRYGSTEAGAIATTLNSQGTEAIMKGDILSVGYACPGVMMKVVDVETRAVLGPKQRGELCVRCPRLMKGYLGATSPYVDDEGYYLTGDLGYYDEQKRFYVLNRIKDIIPYSGYSVCPGEVEAVLLKHEAVQEAAVVGAPVTLDSELPTAFVVLRPGCSATEAELQEFVAERVIWYMQLRGGVRFVSELPRSAQRKILRWRLRDEMILD